jgi:hypothetical protein
MTDAEEKQKLLNAREQFRQVMLHLPMDEVQKIQPFIDQGMRNITDILAERHSNTRRW